MDQEQRLSQLKGKENLYKLAYCNLGMSLDSIFKSRDITLPTKFHLVKAIIFPVVMYGCESLLYRKPSAKELMLLNCGVEEDS